MDKFTRALARHELARQKVDALSRRIGAAIQRCPVVIKSNDWTILNAERSALWDDKTQRHKTHLWNAYNALSVYGEHLDEEGQEEALRPGRFNSNGCRHCLRAFRLIKQRKDARRELGYARLSLRALGRQALKMVENDEH